MEERYSAQPPGLWAKPHFLNTRSSSDVAGGSLSPCGCLCCLSLWRTRHLSGPLPMVTCPVITRPMVTMAQGFLGVANGIARPKVGCQRGGVCEKSYYKVSTSERGRIDHPPKKLIKKKKKTLASQVCPGFSAGQSLAERLQLGVEVSLRRCQDASKPAQLLGR